MFKTLIETEILQQNLTKPEWVVVDCRFDLADPEAGRRAYLNAHIPGAIYAHLEDDLCDQPTTDHGRHPLPSAQVIRARFSRMGISANTQVVVYDDNNGAIASRLWWMLHYMGHDAAAVLDGGWPAWQEAGYALSSGVEVNEPIHFAGTAKEDWLVRLDDVQSLPLLIDSRAPERYRGEVEPIDPRAGHIPGAVNFFYQLNWDENGRYFSPELLRTRFEKLLGPVPADEAVFHCGSGVTACANILALNHAGMGNARLYVGSWSEWCADPSRPAVTGE